MDSENEIRKTEVIRLATEYIQDFFKSESSGHDWWHTYRVYRSSLRLAAELGADPFVCALASLFHDRCDGKIVGDEEGGLTFIRSWLETNGVTRTDADHVLLIISTMSYKAGHNAPMTTIEGKIVQDADRLDALGAIGISRTFAYSGSKGRPIYDPDIRVRERMTLEEYRSGNDSAINHFYEKLLKLKSLMNTESARREAEERHRFMVNFLNQFFREWEDPKA